MHPTNHLSLLLSQWACEWNYFQWTTFNGGCSCSCDKGVSMQGAGMYVAMFHGRHDIICLHMSLPCHKSIQNADNILKGTVLNTYIQRAWEWPSLKDNDLTKGQWDKVSEGTRLKVPRGPPYTSMTFTSTIHSSQGPWPYIIGITPGGATQVAFYVPFANLVAVVGKFV